MRHRVENIIDDVLPEGTLKIDIEGTSDERTFDARGPEDKIRILKNAAVKAGCKFI